MGGSGGGGCRVWFRTRMADEDGIDRLRLLALSAVGRAEKAASEARWGFLMGVAVCGPRGGVIP